MEFGAYREQFLRDVDWYADAEPEYINRVALAEAELGPNHPIVGAHSRNLARLYHEQGKYQEAECWYWRAWAICLCDPLMAPQLRAVLLKAISLNVGNCARSQPV